MKSDDPASGTFRILWNSPFPTSCPAGWETLTYSCYHVSPTPTTTESSYSMAARFPLEQHSMESRSYESCVNRLHSSHFKSVTVHMAPNLPAAWSTAPTTARAVCRSMVAVHNWALPP